MRQARTATAAALTACAVAALATGVAGVAAARHRRRRLRRPRPGGARPDRPVSASTRAARGAEVVRLGARVGTAAAANRAKRVFASAERREALDAELELRTAEEVAATLGNMKGVAMKMGQLASFVDDGMPEPVRQALAQLQQDAPPMSADLAAGVVEAELGAAPADLFAEWDPTPIAAASIGQVHRAITHDDRAVAVKVQYPGVEDAIQADLDGFDVAMIPAPFLYRSFDVRSFVEELRTRIGEELDYVVEAANQQKFADWYRGHPFIHIPEVVGPLSTRRVLTTELASGVRFAELDDWNQRERDLAAETIYRFVFRSLYRMGSFNGDPHPGNYLFRPGGQVTFLDFGLVKHFSADEVDQLMGLTRAMVLQQDKQAFRQACERAGYYPPGSPVSDEAVWDFSLPFWEMVMEDAPFRFTPEYASDIARRFLFGSAVSEAAKHANMPARWVVLQRINVGLIAILGQLRAEANWRQIGDEIWTETNAGPSTPLGEAEFDWWTARHDGG